MPIRLAIAIYVIAALLIICVPMPALDDYPNHLTRMILLTDAQRGMVHPYVQLNPNFVANQAMDIIVPMLAAFMNLELAIRLFMIASKLLIVLGMIAWEYVHKAKIELAVPFSCAVLFAEPLGRGLLNFEFAIGLALVLMSLTIYWLKRNILYSAMIAGLSFVLLTGAHIFAAAIYGIVVMLTIVSRSGVKIRALLKKLNLIGQKKFISSSIWISIYCLTVAASLVIMEYHRDAFLPYMEWDIRNKIIQFIAFFSHEYPIVSAIGMSLLVATLLILYGNGEIKLHRSTRLHFFIFMTLFAYFPFMLMKGTFADGRLLFVLMILLPGMLHVDLRAQSILTRLSLSLGAFYLALTAWSWISLAEPYQQIRDLVAAIPKGSAVMIGIEDRADHQITHATYPDVLYQIPALAVAERQAYVPTLFSDPDQQTVIYREHFQKRPAQAAWIMHTYPVKSSALMSRLEMPLLNEDASRATCQPIAFTHLFLFNAAENPSPSHLNLIKRTDVGSLYQFSERDLCL